MEVSVFYSYSDQDDLFRQELEAHLEVLEKRGMINDWSKQEVSPGSNWEEEINFQIQQAKIILLLISSDFMASDYCYETETIFALEQHENHKAKVIPIIIRPCLWELSHFGHLDVLPSQGKAVSTWENRDLAWVEVARGILKAVQDVETLEAASPQNDTGKDHLPPIDLPSIDENIELEHKMISPSQDTRTHIKRNTPSHPRPSAENPPVKKKQVPKSLLYRFLKRYPDWYFSPLRIQKFGGKQLGFQALAEMKIQDIEAELDSLMKGGWIQMKESHKGNVMYRINSK